MENTEKNYDDVIAKAVTDPEGTMQSLDNAKNTLQQLSDKVNQVKATAGVQDTNSGMQTEDDSTSQWSFEDTIDELMSKISDYTSENTERLNIQQMIDMLLKLEFIQNELKK